MLKEEIIEKISKYFKLTSFEAEKIYNDMFSVIISGVKQDNIVDLANFGEFIIKYNKSNGDTDQSGYKKTVEFLATSKLEDELNQSVIETGILTPAISGPVQEEKQEVTAEDVPQYTLNPLGEELQRKREEMVSKLSKPDEETKIVTPVNVNPVTSPEEKEETSESTTGTPLEEELRRKRESILGKISNPVEEIPQIFQKSGLTKPLWKIPGKMQEKEPVKEQPRERVEQKEVQKEKETQVVENIADKSKNIESTITETPLVEEKKAEIEDLSKQTFSDYFTEVSDKSVHETAPLEQTIEQQTVHNVIPPSVVELHNEITSSTPHETLAFPTVETTPVGVTASGNGSSNGSAGEYRASDNSYYIWYKDVEANATDTQNLSFEYELLYQATKEAEYKSKLKIYVTTFIIFFSIVLVLLIFSPVIYKVFFRPVDTPKTETTNEENPSTEQNNQNNKAEQNVLPDANNTNTQNTNVTPPVTNNDQQPNNTTQQNVQQPDNQTKTQPNTTTQQQPPTQQQTQTQPPPQQNTEPKLDGVTKNAMGWMDDKLKVIYIKLDNGKFTIQESAWDSDAKANKRISAVQSYNIDGLKGTIMKADLGDKGTWFRARFGEFSTLDEAKQKASELRKKEGLKLQASLLFLLLYT
jgi:nucleoid DNA-binding protein